jgi:dipeptidyl aminopeptidase/acylaminoacyl peptidase
MLANINHNRSRARAFHLSVFLLVSATWFLTGTTSPADQEAAPVTKRLVAHEEFVKELAKEFVVIPADCLRLNNGAPGSLGALCGARSDRWYKYQDAAIFSPDGERLAYTERRGTEVFMIVDGKEQGPFATVSRRVVFSPDSKRVVYLAEKKQDMWVAVVDGVEHPPMITIYVPVFSPDSKRLAYHGAKDNHTGVMVIDGAEQASFLRLNDARFSPDGRRLAYIAMAKREGKLEELVVVDGVAQTPYRGVCNPLFSPDGKRLAYVAAKERKTFVVVVDGVEQPILHYDLNTGFGDSCGPGRDLGSLVFSPDGNHLAYGAVGTKRGPGNVVLDGAEQPYSLEGPLVFSPDSKHLAYAAALSRGLKNKVVLVVDGEVRSPEYWSITNVRFSPDSTRLAYTACNWSHTCHAVITGEQSLQFDHIGPVVFSEDSQHFAYAAGTGDSLFSMISDRSTRGNAIGWGTGLRTTQAPLGGDVESFLPRPLISANGAIVAWTKDGTKRGRVWERMMVNGREGPESSSVVALPGFSPDGQHFAYLRRFNLQGRDKEAIVLDEQEGKPYDAVVGQPRFTDNTTVVFKAVDGRRVLRVTQSME